MPSIIPNIWCRRNADEALAFYLAALPDCCQTHHTHYPESGLLDFQREFAGKTLTVDFETRGHRFTLINAGDEFEPNPSLSFMVNFDPLFYGGDEQAARRELEHVWGKLLDGGTALMPLQAYPFSDLFGWVQDRFGVSWQLMLTRPEGEPRPWVMPAFLFGGEVQNRASEAIERWIGSFDDAGLGSIVRYEAEAGPANVGSVMFADFRLADQWFVAMDSGADQDFTFSCGVSLLVDCTSQAEIDRYWSALSRVPEAEQCGWCADEFGVAWQISPADLDDTLLTPESFARFLSMKKIELDQL